MTHVDFEHLDIGNALILLKSDGDFHGCLSNCSNQGRCALNENHTLGCICNDKFIIGDACERNTRPCSRSMCLNNGTCEDLIQDGSIAGFKCTCQKFYYGINCENKIDICENKTCSFHGHCFDNSSIPQCDCYMFYSGSDCEIKSASLVVIKKISSGSLALALVIIIGFMTMIVTMDMINLISWFKNNQK